VRWDRHLPGVVGGLETVLVRLRPDLQEMNLFTGKVSFGRRIGARSTHDLWSLYSLWAIPVPPLVIWTSPRFIVSTLPMLSLWDSSPEMMYEKISNSRCGCVGKPVPGWGQHEPYSTAHDTAVPG